MRCARNASKRSGLPSGFVKSGRPYFSRALLLVTSGGLFWIVAFDPARCAMRGFSDIVILPLSPSRPEAAIDPRHHVPDQSVFVSLESVIRSGNDDPRERSRG